MSANFKRILYFPIASYFRFFAAIRLKRWNPKIVVITGSNGKTTLLHLLESQIGEAARYSHHANSSFGIPFDILDLHRKSLLKSEWISLILKTPFSAFKKPPKERLYIVEADCDRPGEGKFLSELLEPDIVLWVSTAKTHSMNFDYLVNNGKFSTVEEAIAYEFGYFIESAKETVMINGDSELMKNQLNRTQAEVIRIKKDKLLKYYSVGRDGTVFEIDNYKSKFKFLLPEEVFYSIEMARYVCKTLNISFDQLFSQFQMPPGRGSIFKGVKDTLIIDSSYNLSPGSLNVIVQAFNMFSDDNKWIVVGDMLETGESEKEEHEKLAEILINCNLDKIILMGPRVSKYTLPKLKNSVNKDSHVDAFENPKDVLDFLNDNIKGGETILFKGARFMEGIIEHLLENKEDIKKLSRREKIWEIRRKEWGL